MTFPTIHNCAQLIEAVDMIGMLPLLPGMVPGWSADEMVDDDCRYTQLPEGGWAWPLWEWKGAVIKESGCAYGKFFHRKAAFISRKWWPHFCNYRRHRMGHILHDSIAQGILEVLRDCGSMVAGNLRTACGLYGTKMRGRFDAYVASLEMAGYIVTEDFVYSRTKQGREYGWGRALLTTPESLFGAQACRPDSSPEASWAQLWQQLHQTLPQASCNQLSRLLR